MNGRSLGHLALSLVALAGAARSQSLVHVACAPEGAWSTYATDVVGVGDSDLDGFGDVAVPAWSLFPYSGATLLVSGKTGAELLSLPMVGTLAAAGDMNGDGHPELAVLRDDIGADPVLRAFSVVDGSVSLDVVFIDSATGWSPLHGAGDVDGDGLADLLVKMSGPMEQTKGKLISGLDGATLWSQPTDNSLDIAAPGDMDGDGVTDFASAWGFLIGTQFAQYGVTVVSTGGGGLLLDKDVSGFGPAPHVFGAGDVDVDGVPDLGVWRTGSLDVWSGADGSSLVHVEESLELAKGVGDVDADGFPDLAWIGSPSPATFNLPGNWKGLHVVRGPEATPLHVFDGKSKPGAMWGSAFSAVGDLDGDGGLDLAVAAPNDGRQPGSPGCVHFYGFGPPLLLGIEPGTMSLGETGAGTKFTLEGHSLGEVTAVSWNGELVPVPSSSVPGEVWNELSFDPPAAAGPGIARVRVVGPGGSSNLVTAGIGATDPPMLVVPDFAQAGTSLTWSWYGEANELAVLLVSFQPTTFALGGWSVLQGASALHVELIDASTKGSLSLHLPASMPSPLIFFWSQVVTGEQGQLGGASLVEDTLVFGG